MARLSDYLNRSVTQNLGISDILNKRQLEAEQLGQTMRAVSEFEANTIRAERQNRANLLGNIGGALGTAAGFILSGGNPMVAGAAGKLGQGFGQKGVSGLGEAAIGVAEGFIKDQATKLAFDQNLALSGYKPVPENQSAQSLQPSPQSAQSAQSSPVYTGADVGPSLPLPPPTMAPLSQPTSQPLQVPQQSSPSQQIMQPVRPLIGEDFQDGIVNIPMGEGKFKKFYAPNFRMDSQKLFTEMTESLKNLNGAGWIPTDTPGPNDIQTTFGTFTYSPEAKVAEPKTPKLQSYFDETSSFPGKDVHRLGTVDQVTGQVIRNPKTDAVFEVKRYKTQQQQNQEEALKLQTEEQKRKNEELKTIAKQNFEISKSIDRNVANVRGDKNYSALKDQINKASTIVTLLNQKSPIGDKITPVMLQRAIGDVGNIAVYEQQNNKRFGSVSDIFNQAIETAATGKIIEKNRALIIDVLNQMSNKAKLDLNAQIESSKQTSLALYGSSPDSVKLIENAYKPVYFQTKRKWREK